MPPRQKRAYGPYSLLYVDPPWPFQCYNVAKAYKHVSAHYNTMSFDDIAALGIGDLGAKDSALAMWVTFPTMLYEDKPGEAPAVHRILKAWGYTYRTVLFTWEKVNQNNGKPRMGMGFYTRGNAEICILATRGKALPRYSRSVEQIVRARLRAHSQKPWEIYGRLGELFGYDIPRAECFARVRWPLWDQAYSNQADLFTPKSQDVARYDLGALARLYDPQIDSHSARPSPALSMAPLFPVESEASA